jgi:iron-sulfur cluster assembly accessory protein
LDRDPDRRLPRQRIARAKESPIHVAHLAIFEDAAMAISVSSSARVRLKELFSKHPDARALRVGIRGGGCSGYSYLFEFEKEEPSSKDKVIDFEDFTIYVDTKSYFFLNGSELDFIDELMGKRFQFNNPNVKSSCGCGESVAF